MLGTASPTRGFLLVEEAGPWGPGAVPRSRLGETATQALREVAASISAKLLLVRRPGGAAGEERTLLRVSCTRGRERVITRRVAQEASAMDVAEAAASRRGWSDVAVDDGGPLLVCTHGRKDWCCARRGRPLAAALAQLAPQRVWECSHLGGDRFAANLLSLPTGWTWGRVDVDDAAAVVAATAAGELVPELLRGRCCDAMVVQAADVHARLALGRSRTDDLVPRRARRADAGGGPEAWVVDFDDPAAGGALSVRVRAGHVASAQRLTCSAEREEHARTWELVELVPAPPRAERPGQAGT